MSNLLQPYKQDHEFVDKSYPSTFEQRTLSLLFPWVATDWERRLSDLRCELISDQDGSDTSMAAVLQDSDLF